MFRFFFTLTNLDLRDKSKGQANNLLKRTFTHSWMRGFASVSINYLYLRWLYGFL